MRWMAHLSDVQVHQFLAASGPNIALDIPSKIDLCEGDVEQK